MSLISEYRNFASIIVYRLGQGALGSGFARRLPVLICIDELDKIVESNDIRAFVKRIKAIFEVPGVYYYISLAEDTLTSLYLGPAEGKNEIDSSFDHIIRIPPLSCDTSAQIANTYLAAHLSMNYPVRLARTLGAISFGIPRDVIRRCDEYIAQEGAKLAPDQVVFKMRKTQGTMGYELSQLSKEEFRELTSTPLHSAVKAKASMESKALTDSAMRLILSLWVLSLIESVSTLPDETLWSSASAELCEIGYRIPIDRITDLVHEIGQIHDRLALA